MFTAPAFIEPAMDENPRNASGGTPGHTIGVMRRTASPNAEFQRFRSVVAYSWPYAVGLWLLLTLCGILPRMPAKFAYQQSRQPVQQSYAQPAHYSQQQPPVAQQSYVRPGPSLLSPTVIYQPVPVAQPSYPTPPVAQQSYARPVSPVNPSVASLPYIKPSGTGLSPTASGVATVVTLGIVGGLFWWVTSGPRMAARSNPSVGWPWR